MLLTWLAGFGLLIPLVNHLKVEWEINPQYSYGWGAMGLTLYLFWKRWEDRPIPGNLVPGWLMGLVTVSLLGMLGPVLLVEESNPDWRPITWIHVWIVVGLWLSGLASIGGRRWLLHFVFPVCFLMVCVPWPTPVEQTMVQALMRLVSGITVESINWFGVPAVQRGNLIDVPGGTIGVSEACSGVRSFQGTLMAALFFGELYRFGIGKRVWMLVFGTAVAVALNTLRTTSLAWIHIRGGGGAVDRWHDPAGLVVLLLAFFSLGAFALVMRGPAAAGESGRSGIPRSAVVPHLPVSYSIVVGSVVAILHLATELYYRSAESALTSSARWTVEWPKLGPGFRFDPLDEETLLLLRVNEGRSGVWKRASGSQWYVFFLRWDPGRAAANLARAHSPELCLPAGGVRLVRGYETVPFEVGGLSIPFRAYLFDFRGSPMHVFFCVWENRSSAGTGANAGEDFTRRGRLRAVSERRRHQGQQVLELAVLGPRTYEEARREAASGLADLIRVEPVQTKPSDGAK